MIRIFSRFDFYIFGLKFLIPLLFLVFSFLISINFSRTLTIFLKEFKQTFYLIIFLIKNKKVRKFIRLICLCLFISIFFFNFRSIFPFTFSFTTQISIVFFSALVIWLRFIFFGLKNNCKNFISHKVPEGCPMNLSIFLFLIEIISEVIRPLTLRLRLVGNIVVGHVLLILLYKLIVFFSFVSPLFIVLNTVEILVCLIQSYIFFILIVIYCREL